MEAPIIHKMCKDSLEIGFGLKKTRAMGYGITHGQMETQSRPQGHMIQDRQGFALPDPW